MMPGRSAPTSSRSNFTRSVSTRASVWSTSTCRPSSSSARKSARIASDVASGAETTTMPANLPAACDNWLCSQLPPRALMAPAMSETRPGRSTAEEG